MIEPGESLPSEYEDSAASSGEEYGEKSEDGELGDGAKNYGIKIRTDVDVSVNAEDEYGTGRPYRVRISGVIKHGSGDN